eukprot:COSAG01_NODE_3735_length_5748_cov_33.771464_5_plen_27_part_01
MAAWVLLMLLTVEEAAAAVGAAVREKH